MLQFSTRPVDYRKSIVLHSIFSAFPRKRERMLAIFALFHVYDYCLLISVSSCHKSNATLYKSHCLSQVLQY